MEAAAHLPEHPALRLQVLVTLRAQLQGEQLSILYASNRTLDQR